MITLDPLSPPCLQSPMIGLYWSSQGESRAAQPASSNERTLDAPERSSTMMWAMGSDLNVVVRYKNTVAVIFTLNQYKVTSLLIPDDEVIPPAQTYDHESRKPPLDLIAF
jgi:hypothetical protein